jgi:hypothetical protein
MAVIINESACNLSDANAFYLSEAYQLGSYYGNSGTAAVSLATGKAIAVTFAHNVNLRGVVLALAKAAATYTANTQSVTCDLQQIMGTCTMATGTPGIVTLAGHGLSADQLIQFSTTGALLSPLVAGTQYYVRNPAANTFEVALTPGGASLAFTGTQSGVHTLYAIRATATLTAAQIQNSLTIPAPLWIKRFNFTPYAIDTTTGKWRFWIYQSGGSGTWYLGNSDNTLAGVFYLAWGDTAVTASDTNDCVWAGAKITINESFRLKPYAPGGSPATVIGICGGMCSSATPLTPNMWEWKNPPSSSYTLTIDGMIVMAAHAGFAVGASGAGFIPYAQQAILTLIAAPTVGAAIYSGFYDSCSFGPGSRSESLSTFIMYGEIPSPQIGILNADAAAGQKEFYTTLSTGWSIGDTVFLDKEDLSGQGDVTVNTIANIATNHISLTNNIAGSTRKAGGMVFNASAKYGIRLQSNTTTQVKGLYLGFTSNFQYVGVMNYAVGISNTCINAAVINLDDAANTSKWVMSDACFYTDTFNGNYLSAYNAAPIKGWDILRCYFHRLSVLLNQYKQVVPLSGVNYVSGTLTIKDCYAARITYGFFGTQSNNYTLVWDIENCTITNSAGTFIVCVGNRNTLKNNSAYSCAGIAYQFGPFTNPVEVSGNYADACLRGVNFAAMQPSVAAIMDSFYLGTNQANTTSDISFSPDCFLSNVVLTSPRLTTVETTFGYDISQMQYGCGLAITNFNNTTNDDRYYQPFGRIQRTGTSLTDTTVHTSGAGAFAIRLESISSINPLTWVFNIPTGNIQSKTMMVGIWVNINVAAYYAGVNQLPRLTINYDNGTVVYAQALAATGWQYISVPFTPATSYGQITVTLSTMTDAVGANAYVYWDDISVLYPAGYQLNLGNLDLWANALPVTPPISTNLSALDVWAALVSTLTGAGTIGALLATDIDAAISSRLATAGYTTPPTVGDINTTLGINHGSGSWEGGTPPSPAAIASEVWSYFVRTLTQNPTAVTYAALTGAIMIVKRNITLSATLIELVIPGTWTRIYLTAKNLADEEDAKAVLQVVVSNPGVGTDGLKYLNGAAAATWTGITAADASLVVDAAAGTILVTVSDEATALMGRGMYSYDVKCLLADGTSQELATTAPFLVEYAGTKALV